MDIVAVDLAARYSAICRLDQAGVVVDQVDSWGRTEDAFLTLISNPWSAPQPPLELVVEDLPHRLPFASLVKQVCRIQGRIIHRMNSLGHPDQPLFVPPALWRKHFTGLERGTGPDAVTGVAADLGYTPPDLTERAAVKGGKAIARKVATDYAAAYLIARWAWDMHTTHGTVAVAGTSRYTTPARKAR